MMATIEREMGVFDSGRVWPLGVSGSAMGVFGKWLRLQIDLLGHFPCREKPKSKPRCVTYMKYNVER
jgi:hypothetical protein